MNKNSHIPYFNTIGSFFQSFRLSRPVKQNVAIIQLEELKRLRGLDIPLFRCGFYSLILFSKPKMNVLLDKAELSTYGIYFSYPQELEHWQSILQGEGYCLFFTEGFIKLEGLPTQGKISLSSTEANPFKIYQERMLQEMRGDHQDKNEMIRLLLHQYLIQLRRIQQQQLDSRPRSEQNALATFNRFKNQLNQYFEELAEGKADYQASVSLLADRLHLNASYLNTLIKNLTGKTASSYINEKIILEAQSYLMYTDYQVAEISFRLGFSNVTYFNRFFKKWTQTTPVEFRKSFYPDWK